MASISTVLVRPLMQALEPRGLRELFAKADLTKEIALDPEARVSPAQFCIAWAEALRLSGDSALALAIAKATPAGAFGIVEYVCRSQKTVKDALVQWCRYLAILDDAVEVRLEGTSLRVVRESEAPAPASHELCFALVFLRARELAPGFRVAEVRYGHRSSEPDRHRAFFGAPVVFGARHTEMIIERDVLDLPLATADANLLAILTPAAEEKRRSRSKELPFTEQVSRALRAALSSDDAQLDAVAKRMGMTGRSLQRRLKDEDTSFQDLRENTRRELANHYLAEDLSLSEIAFLLGFSEPSAFFRAFKRWTGKTPLEARAQL